MPLKFDPNTGDVLAPSQEEFGSMDAEYSVLTYTTGVMDDGKPYYAYIAVTPSKYVEFHSRIKSNESMILGDYGVVILSDFLPEAPTDVKEHMRKEYGFSENYETILKQSVDEERKVFFKKEEDNRIQNALQMLIKKRDAENKS